MAVEGYELKTSDLEAMVEFIHSVHREIAAKTSHGSINSIPYNDPIWLAEDETMVERHLTDWKEVSIDASQR